MIEIPSADNYRTQEHAELAAMAHYRREYRKGLSRRPLAELIAEYEWFENLVIQHPGHLDEDERILEEIHHIVEQQEARMISAAQRDCPIAYIKPSYDQCQKLNAWHPDFVPDVAPAPGDAGYQSVVDFGGKRTAKTFGDIIDTLLWILPVPRDAMVFDEFEDPFGRGKYRVLPRCNWDYWQRTGKMVEPLEGEPPKAECAIWHGVPDELHWHLKTEKVWRQLMPEKWVGYEGKTRLWMKAERWFKTKWGHIISAKLYGSDVLAWAGDEVWTTLFDEGPPVDKLDEAIIRSRRIRIAYTPDEDANTADRVILAEKIYHGRHPLVGKVLRVRSLLKNVPGHVMDPKAKAERMETASRLGDKGKIIVEGGFLHRSPTVFTNFEPKRHVLPVTGEQVIRAIRGELRPDEKAKTPWLEKFHRANVIRGFDEGTAHPTACVYCALLRSGELVAFLEYEASDTSIVDRARKVVELCGNTRQIVQPTKMPSFHQHDVLLEYAQALKSDREREQAIGTTVVRYREVYTRLFVRRTFADSKMFKRDPTFPLDNWVENYTRAGLKMERAVNIGPAQRFDYVNGLFLPDHTRRHLNPAQCDIDHQEGFALYLTVNCERLRERLENLRQATFMSGPKRGELTGNPVDRDDDICDGLSYAATAKMRWIEPETLMSRYGSTIQTAA